MTTIDASVLRAAWAASRPDVETYLAKCDEPARYRSWAGNAFGLRALLKAAGIRVPVDHKGDEVGGCFDWTHLHYFGFGSGAAESTLASPAGPGRIDRASSRTAAKPRRSASAPGSSCPRLRTCSCVQRTTRRRRGATVALDAAAPTW